jgi:adenosylcobyric acid synthase
MNNISEIASALLKEKGLEYEKHTSFNFKEYKERQYDLLAAALRESLDMEYIYKVIEEGI